jgi:hypothetical protein
MLTFQPEKRLSGHEALNHEWFRMNHKENQKIAPSIIENLNKFQVGEEPNVDQV